MHNKYNYKWYKMILFINFYFLSLYCTKYVLIIQLIVNYVANNGVNSSGIMNCGILRRIKLFLFCMQRKMCKMFINFIWYVVKSIKIDKYITIFKNRLIFYSKLLIFVIVIKKLFVEIAKRHNNIHQVHNPNPQKKTSKIITVTMDIALNVCVGCKINIFEGKQKPFVEISINSKNNRNIFVTNRLNINLRIW